MSEIVRDTEREKKRVREQKMSRLKVAKEIMNTYFFFLQWIELNIIKILTLFFCFVDFKAAFRITLAANRRPFELHTSKHLANPP